MAAITIDIEFRAQDEASAKLGSAMAANTKLAQDFGKAVGDALSFDNRESLRRIKEITDSMGVMVKSAGLAGSAVAEFLSVGFATAEKNIRNSISNINADLDKLIQKAGTLPNSATPNTAKANAQQTQVPKQQAKQQAIQQISTIPTISVVNASPVSQAVVNQTIGNVKAINNSVKSIKDVAAITAKESAGAFDSFFGANFFGNLAAQGVSNFFSKMDELFQRTVLYAARTEELGVALTSLARVNKIGTEEINFQEQAIKRLNITTQDTRETIARFVNVGFDLNKASPLARVAQDLAVIGNKSTSDELNALTIAIQTLQSRNLRSAGVFLTVDEILDKLSNTTGRARDSFSTLEKQQAVLNAVIEYGSRVAGTYTASMSTASKQIRSMDRLVQEAENSIGELFVPTLLRAVEAASALLKAVEKHPVVFVALTTTVGALSAAFIALSATAIPGIATAMIGLVTSAKEVISVLTLQTTSTQKLTVNKLANAEATLLESRNELAAIKWESRRVLSINSTATALERKAMMQKVVNAQTTMSNAEIGVSTAKTAGFVASISSAVSGLFLLIGAIGLVVAAYSAYKDAANAKLELDSLDVNAAKKYADDLKNVIANQEKLNTLRADKSLTSDQLKIRELDISKSLSIEEQARLRILSQQVELRGDLAKALEVEKKSIEGSIEAQKKVAVTNFSNSLQNFNTSIKELTKAEERFSLLTDIRDKQLPELTNDKLNTYSKSYFGEDGGAGGKLNIKTYFGFTDNEKLKQVNNPDQSNPYNKGYLTGLIKELPEATTEVNRLNKELGEQKAIMQSAAQDLQKVAISYGVTSRDLIANSFVGKEKDKAEELIVAFNKATDAKNKLIGGAAISDAQTPEVRISNLLKDLGEKQIADYDSFMKQLEERSKQIVEQNSQITARNSSKIPGQEDIPLITDVDFDKARQNNVKGFYKNLASGQAGEELRSSIDAIFADQLLEFEKANGVLNGSDRKKKYEELKATFEAQKLPTGVIKDIQETAKGIDFSKIGVDLANLSGADLTKSLVVDKDKRDAMIKWLNDLTSSGNNIQETFDKAKQELDNLFSENPATRKMILDTEDMKSAANDIRKLQRLSRDLGTEGSFDSKKYEGKPELAKEDIIRFEQLKKAKREQFEMTDKAFLAQQAINRETEKEKGLRGQISTLEQDVKLDVKFADLIKQVEALERQKKIRDEIHKLQNAQLDAETELTIAQQSLNVAVVSAETRAQTVVYKGIRDRRDAERQLTADIAVEVDRRSRYNLNSLGEINRLTAEVFLTKQQDERGAQEGLLKAIIGQEYDKGNTSVFEDNPMIKEAAKQSEVLGEVQKQGGIAVLVANRTNEILTNDIKGGLDTIYSSNMEIGNRVQDFSNVVVASFTRMETSITNAIATASTAAADMSGQASGTGAVGGWWTPERIQTSVQYLMKNAGLSEIGAKGLTARWAGVEAGGGPGSVNPNGGATGIGQWLGARKNGVVVGDFMGQLAHAVMELNGSERAAGNRLRNARTAQDGAIGASMFERAEGYNSATGTDNYVNKTIAVMGRLGILNAKPVNNQIIRGSVVNVPKTTTGEQTIDNINKLSSEQQKNLNALKKSPVKYKELLAQYQAATDEANEQSANYFLNVADSITRNGKLIKDYTKIENEAATEVVNSLSETENDTKNLVTQYRANKADAISAKEYRDIRDEYSRKAVDLKLFEGERNRANIAGESDKLRDLKITGSASQEDVAAKARIDKVKEEQALVTESLKLDEESRFRRIQGFRYEENIRTTAVNRRRSEAFKLQDDLANIDEEERYRREEAATFELVLMGQVAAERRRGYITSSDELKKSIEEQIQFEENIGQERIKIANDVEAGRLKAMLAGRKDLMTAEEETSSFANNKADEILKIWREVEATRLRTTVTTEKSLITAQAQSTSFFKNIAEERRNIWMTMEAERLTASETVTKNIIRLEAELTKGTEGVADRLREKWLELQKTRQDSDEVAKVSQLESISKIEENSIVSMDKIRAKVYEHASAAQSVNETIAGTFTDTFDAINGAFGKGIDKLTANMGAAGGVVGNMLKSITKRITSQIEAAIIGPGQEVMDAMKPVNKEDQERAMAEVAQIASTNIDMLAQSALIASQNLQNVGVDNGIGNTNQSSAADLLNFFNNGTSVDSNDDNSAQGLLIKDANIQATRIQTQEIGRVTDATRGLANGMTVTAGGLVGTVTRFAGGLGGILSSFGRGLGGFFRNLFGGKKSSGGNGITSALNLGISGLTGNGSSGSFTSIGPGGTAGFNGAASLGLGGSGVGAQLAKFAPDFFGNKAAGRNSSNSGGNPLGVDFGFGRDNTLNPIRSSSGQGRINTTLGGAAQAGIFGSQAGGLSGLGSRLGGRVSGIGLSLAQSSPMLGAGLGASIGGGSGIGGVLGGAGGLLAGAIGGAALTAALTSATLFGTAAVGATAATSGTLATFGLGAIGGPIGLAIAGGIAAVLLIGGYLFGKKKREKADIKKVNEAKGAALQQMQDLLKAVKGDKMDGADAIERALGIKTEFMELGKALKTKKGRAEHAKQASELDAVILQIRDAASSQEQRKRINEKLVPTYATGGVQSGEFAQVSRGETILSPAEVELLGGRSALKAAGVPGYNKFRSGNEGTGFGLIPGQFDGRDDLMTKLPNGFTVLTPAQVRKMGGSVAMRKANVRGYATGGVHGSVAPSSGVASSSNSGNNGNTQPIIVVVVADENMAQTIVSQTPNAVIAGKTIAHVEQTGSSGLAGVIGKALTQ